MIIPLYALNAQTITNYKAKDGLPSNYVYKVLQDHNGFIWATTTNGITKFDGKTFKIFSIKDGLPTNKIWDLKLTKDNRIWFFSKNKYQGYIENDIIYKFSSKENTSLLPRTFFQRNGEISFISNHKLYELINNQWTIMEVMDNWKKELIGFKNNKRLYVKFDSTGTDIIIKNNLNIEKKIHHYPTFFHEPYGKTQINDSISVIVGLNKLIFININSEKITEFSLKDIIPNTIGRFIRINSINNQIQVCGVGFVISFNNKLKAVRIIKIPSSIKHFNAIIDKSGNIWTNDLTEGLNFINNSKTYTSAILSNQNIEKIKIIDHSIYIGAHNKNVYAYNLQNKKSKRLFTSQGFIRKFVQLNHLNKKIAITESPNYLFDDNGAEKMPFFSIKNKKFISGPKAFHFSDNKFYIATNTHFHIFNKNKKEIFVIPYEGIECIYKKDTQIYLCSNDGLKIFKNRTIQPYSKAKNISSYTINLIQKFNKKWNYAGTGGMGIFLFNKDQIHPIPASKGLNIYGSVIDKNKKVWLATDKGVYKIKINESNPTKSIIEDIYTTSDGLPTNGINDIDIYDNSLYVASFKGINTININKQHLEKPQIYIDKISMGDVSFHEDSIHIKFSKKNQINVSFGVLDFLFQKNSKFFYKLLPNEQEWNSIKSTEVNLTALQPGNYNLQIKAINHHQMVSVKSIKINITARWWQTIYFKLLMIILSGIILYYLIRIYLKRERRIIKDKEKIATQVSKLELKALRSQMNPHFVFNSINAIQYYLNMNEIEQTEKYLIKFAELIRLFLDYSSIQLLTLEQEKDLLSRYLDIEKLRFGDKFNYIVDTCDDLNIMEAQIPSMLLQPIVENSVNHGIFHRKSNGVIKVHFDCKKNNTFEVVIEDNGIGRKKSIEIQKKSLKSYESKSTSIIKERIALINQSKEFEITYNVIDKPNDSGTIVTLIIKNKLNES